MYIPCLQGQHNWTCLHYACANGHNYLAKELVEMYQLDPNAVDKVYISTSNGAPTNCMDSDETMMYYWYDLFSPKIYFLSGYGRPSKICSFTSSVTITHPVSSVHNASCRFKVLTLNTGTTDIILHGIRTYDPKEKKEILNYTRPFRI